MLLRIKKHSEPVKSLTESYEEEPDRTSHTEIPDDLDTSKEANTTDIFGSDVSCGKDL